MEERSGARSKISKKQGQDPGHQPTSATEYYAQQGDAASQAVRRMYDPAPNLYRGGVDLRDIG